MPYVSASRNISNICDVWIQVCIHLIQYPKKSIQLKLYSWPQKSGCCSYTENGFRSQLMWCMGHSF